MESAFWPKTNECTHQLSLSLALASGFLCLVFFLLSITLRAERARCHWAGVAQIMEEKINGAPRQLISINRKWREKLGGAVASLFFLFFAAVRSCLYFVLWGRFLFLPLDDMLLYSTRALIARRRRCCCRTTARKRVMRRNCVAQKFRRNPIQDPERRMESLKNARRERDWHAGRKSFASGVLSVDAAL